MIGSASVDVEGQVVRPGGMERCKRGFADGRGRRRGGGFARVRSRRSGQRRVARPVPRSVAKGMWQQGEARTRATLWTRRDVLTIGSRAVIGRTGACRVARLLSRASTDDGPCRQHPHRIQSGRLAKAEAGIEWSCQEGPHTLSLRVQVSVARRGPDRTTIGCINDPRCAVMGHALKCGAHLPLVWVSK